MKYNTLIKQSPKVSEIGLGAWQLGINSGWKGLSDKEASELIRNAIEEGVNFFDTAPNYGLGTSELRLGKALKEIDRGHIVLNTKFGHTYAGGTNYEAGYLRKSLEGSLKRLQVDYVDSFLLHNPPYTYLDGNTNPHYDILEQLKAEGKIKAYGASLDSFQEMDLFLKTTQGEVIEAFFNILHQDTRKAFDLAKKKQVGIIAKIPFDSGWLTGKYNEASIFEGVRARWSLEDIKTRATLVRKLQSMLGAGEHLPHMALAFCLAYDAVATVIPGSTSIEQLRKNVGYVQGAMSGALREELEVFYEHEVKALGLPW